LIFPGPCPEKIKKYSRQPELFFDTYKVLKTYEKKGTPKKDYNSSLKKRNEENSILACRIL